MSASSAASPEFYKLWLGSAGAEWWHNAPEQYSKERLLRMCGEAGCQEWTHAVIEGHIPPNLDLVGGKCSHVSVASAPSRDVHGLNSLCRLTTLKELHMSATDLTSDQVADAFTSFTSRSLRLLSLRDCSLRRLPISADQLNSLEELHIINTDLSSSAEVVDAVSSLTNLRGLTLSGCKLKDLPSGLSELSSVQVLDLSHNNFSTLPDVISSLSSLKELNLGHCALANIPPRVDLSELEMLTILDLRHNLLTRLPPSVCDLINLQTLIISGNEHLQRLDYFIVGLENLNQIALEGCTSLDFPPYDVCSKGIPHIRQYFADLGIVSYLTLATVAVIGQTQSGKSHFIERLQTLQSDEQQKVLADRDRNCDFYEMKGEPDSAEKMSLRFLELGGQEMYHLTHRLTLKQNCIPVFVVNMEQYKDMCAKVGERETVRHLFLDWMSHVYQEQPDLMPPKLVLTHKDKLTDDDDFLLLKLTLLKVANDVRHKVISEGKLLQDSDFDKMGHFSDQNAPVFYAEDIFDIDSEADSLFVFKTIKDSLYKTCLLYVKPPPQIPHIWKEIMEQLQKFTDDSNTFEEIFARLTETHGVDRSHLKVILTHMHDCGKLLWYNDVPSLSEYVFPNIHVVTDLLKVLSAHEENVWPNRLKKFQPTMIEGHVKEYDLFEDLVQNFLDTGVMNHTVLSYLLLTETGFKTAEQIKVALALLSSFRIVLGPFSHGSETNYILPYFSFGYLDPELEAEVDVKFHLDINFTGLSPPQYVYHQMTIGVLHMFEGEGDRHVVTQNGATVFHGATTISIAHDLKSRKCSLLLSTDVEDITRSWSHMMNITNSLIKHIRVTWSASRFVCVFYCPHCLLTSSDPLVRKVNPPWCDVSGPSLVFKAYERHPGIDSVVCGRDRHVPKPLKLPCTELSAQDIAALRTSIRRLRNDSAARRRASSGITKLAPAKRRRIRNNIPEEQLSDISDDEDGYIFPAYDPSKVRITLRASPTVQSNVQDLFKYYSDEVYKMSTPVRGRALVINNSFYGTDMFRPGSLVDLDNMIAMLQELSFDVIAFKDLTAQEMLSTIGDEVKNAIHKDYNMFVLVIMSHGAENNRVYGIDHPVAIDLTHVYDLLSPEHFLLMSGKPKLVIIQACSGARRGLPPHRQAGNRPAAPQASNQAAAPHTSNQAAAPQADHQDAAPQAGNQAAAPHTSNQAAAPQPSSQAAAPQAGNQAAVPQSGNQAAAPQENDQAAGPQASNQAATPLQAANPVPAPGAQIQLDSIPPANRNVGEIDDLLIIKASFEGYVSTRHAQFGSTFIRCLVTTFYKHANHRDVYRLSEIIQDRVRTESSRLAGRHPETLVGLQVPICIKTLTRDRKLYLFPKL